jgi:BASS family bile acid:Na+ symporter
MDLIYWLTLTLTVWATVALVGFTHAPHQLRLAASRARVVGPVVVLSCIGMPLLAWVTSRILNVPALESTGILLVAAASAGPLSLKVVDIAKGDLSLAMSLVLILELANIVIIPLWPALLLPDGVGSPALDVARSVIVLIVLPLIASWALRAWRPAVTERLVGPLRRASTVGFVAALILVLARSVSVIPEVAGSGVLPVAVVTLIVGMLAAAVVVGNGRPTRIAASMVTGVRANATALAVAGTAFAGQPRVTAAIVVFGLVSIALPSLAAVALARRRATETNAGSLQAREPTGLTSADGLATDREA